MDTSEVTADNHEFTDVKEFNRVTHYYPALDKIIFELKNRFSENDNKVLCSLGKILTMEKPDEESFQVVSDFYALDEDSLKSDIKILSRVRKERFSSKCSVQCIFKHIVTSQTQILMPEICKAMKIYSVIPATSCSAERSFSCLRRLKTYLRSTMLQERLSNLAIISIEPAFVN